MHKGEMLAVAIGKQLSYLPRQFCPVGNDPEMAPGQMKNCVILQISEKAVA